MIPRDATYNSIVVPTMDTVRNEYLIHRLVVHGHHVLCTGDTGTGKSVTAKKKLLFGMGPKFSSIMLNFSAQTSANQVRAVTRPVLQRHRVPKFRTFITNHLSPTQDFRSRSDQRACSLASRLDHQP